MKIIELIKNNSKLYMLMGIIIFFGTIGVTLAALIESFNAIAINTTTSSIDANITYDVGTNTAEVINNGNLLPISDDLVTGVDVTDTRVLKVSFNVSGENTNPDNTIYDIAMYFNELDCELRTSDLKWRLYKNNELLNFGSLSPTYDTMAKNRLVLTNIQEDLTTNEDKYVFLLWISESCTGDITTCDPNLDQSEYLNKVLKGNIKVELSTGSKKAVERVTASEGTCDYIETELPVCNTLTYNGNEQTLLRETTNNYTINNNTGINAGNYTILLNLNEGYKWTDGSIDDKKIYCSINKKSATVTSKDQTIVYGSNISSEVSNVNSSGLLTGNTINKVTLNSSIYDVGTGNINVDFVQIQDSQGNDITNNYNIDKKGTGKVTINCSNTAEEPTLVDKEYTDLNQVELTKGKYIEVIGNKAESNTGTYTINVVPQKNYCWSDGTTTAREYTWEIVPGKLNILLTTKTEAYTGSKINISDAIITDASGNRVFDIDVTYKYYNGNTCTGNALEDAPVNAGIYSVKAFSEKTDNYDASESNCVTLTITKAEGTVTANTRKLTMMYKNPGTFNYTSNSDGNVTCSSSNTNVATCSTDNSNKNVTVEPVSVGSTTLTLTLDEGTNHATATDTIEVEIQNTVGITIKRDGTSYSGLTVNLYQNSTSKYNNPTYLDGVYTFSNVANGTYDIYIGGTDTGTNIEVSNTGSATINYYTLTLNRGVEGGISSTSGSGIYLSGTNVNINAILNSGYTFNSWTVNKGNTPSSTTSASTTVNITSTTTLTARWNKTVTGSFHYYNGTTNTTQTTQCTYDDTKTSCNFTVPSVVSSSTGPNNAPYYGVSNNLSSSTITTTYNSSVTNYYAVYNGTLVATYTKENDNVSSIGKTTDSCQSYKYYDGTSYISESCNITLPDITPSSGYMINGWYNSSDTKAGMPSDSVTLTNDETFIAKATEQRELTSSDFYYDGTNSNSSCTNVTCALDELYKELGIGNGYEGDSGSDIPTIESFLQVGDYVIYNPIKDEYETDPNMTGYEEIETIYPSELNLWRVLNKNDDGSIEIISEYVSSTGVTFRGQTGYLNYVGYLNTLARQYETEGITSGSRHFGYNGQTEYLDPSKVQFSYPPPITESTFDNSNEAFGGGDILYEKDYNDVYAIYEHIGAINVQTQEDGVYYVASRIYNYSYYYDDESDFEEYFIDWSIAISFGDLSDAVIYSCNSYDGCYDSGPPFSLRPIVTLKPGLTYTGEGTSGSPWQIVG